MRIFFAIVAVLLLACNTPIDVSPSGLQVLSKGGPPVKLQVNGRDVVEVACNGGELLTPGEKDLPRLPWNVKVISMTDGRTLLDQRVTALPRWLLVMRDSAGVSASPISGPFVPCP